jgi:L-ascorbate metabolism protein UlaG (beta-lactamase superfamily)
MDDRMPGCRIRWLGAAGFELDLDSVRGLIDPFLSRSCDTDPVSHLRSADLDAQAIFVTHGHLDHAMDVPAIARQTGASVYASTTVCAALHDLGVSARKLHPLAAGRALQIGHVSVLAVAARHVRFDLPLLARALRRVGWRAFRLLRVASAYPCGDVLGYQFSMPEGRAIHFGSAGWYRSELERLQPDVALLPLQGHSRVHELAARAAAWMGPKRVIVHHHDDFCPPLSERVDIDRFVKLMRERLPGVEVIEPRIGEWMSLFR